MSTTLKVHRKGDLGSQFQSMLCGIQIIRDEKLLDRATNVYRKVTCENCKRIQVR